MGDVDKDFDNSHTTENTILIHLHVKKELYFLWTDDGFGKGQNSLILRRRRAPQTKHSLLNFLVIEIGRRPNVVQIQAELYGGRRPKRAPHAKEVQVARSLRNRYPRW